MGELRVCVGLLQPRRLVFQQKTEADLASRDGTTRMDHPLVANGEIYHRVSGDYCK